MTDKTGLIDRPGYEQVAELASRLACLDLSAESAIRERLRHRLEQRLVESKPRNWLEAIRQNLPAWQYPTWVKLALVAMVILAQSLMMPAPQAVKVKTLEPNPPVLGEVTSQSMDATQIFSGKALSHPMPVPTPGLETAFTPPMNGRQAVFQPLSAPAFSTLTSDQTPKPTPLAPIATLP